MSESFLTLSISDRKEALAVAASKSGRPAHILEKDVWVVWTLNALFDSKIGTHLVFKGGTSLSKAYHAIRRFSEDIDITFDIREMIPEKIKANDGKILPLTRSQANKWVKEINQRLPEWIKATVAPLIQETLKKSELSAQTLAEGASLYMSYETHTTGYGYIKPRIQIDFGARSTGEPAEMHDIVCDAAKHLDLSFPTARARVMVVERTFWEKATAVHVFCLQGDVSDRLARHWYDLAKLDESGIADRALKEREIADAVAEHKGVFFIARDAKGEAIDYSHAVNGHLQLVPTGSTLEKLATDYQKMIDDGLFLDDAQPFDDVVKRCAGIQDRANKRSLSPTPDARDVNAP